ncbi:MAG: mechanosensitive ion channel, partial [Flavobacteriales bacterium]|nr:mechanosensitive ion channel [Flavobacteriales bacterium]
MNYTTQLDRLDLFLIRWGIAPEHVPWIGALIGSLLVFVVMGLLSKLLNLLLTIGLKRFSTSTRTHFDDHLLHYRVPRYVARIVPLVLSYHLVPIILRDEGTLQYVVLRAFNVFFIVLFIRIVRAFMRAGRDTLKDSPTYRDKPLDSYVQIASLVIYVIAGILIFSQLTGRSALTFLTAMGAASAVLLLIFKDAILGFVASIQISANDMVRPGDWITMPKYGADGDIVEINLTTVKVANWDKTITT